MSAGDWHDSEHEVLVQAPADLVYRLLAYPEHWSWVFPATVHAERLPGGATGERVGIWTLSDGEVFHWVARRTLSPAQRQIDYRQEQAQHPVAEMGGRWRVSPAAEGRSRVRLRHDYRAVRDDPETLGWIAQVEAELSTAELAALKASAETYAGCPERLFSFADTLHIKGCPATVYQFLLDVEQWPDRIPDVLRGDVLWDGPAGQVIAVDTSTGHGTYASRTVRLCVPDRRIITKQLQLPPLATAHTGELRLQPAGEGVAVTARHTVVFTEPGIAQVLGAEATLGDAREFARAELGTSSLRTLERARAYAEHANHLSRP
jgi:aromatase